MNLQVEEIEKIPNNNFSLITGEQLNSMLTMLVEQVYRKQVERRPIPLSVAADHFGVTEGTLRTWAKNKVNGFPIHKMNGGKGNPVIFWDEVTDAVLRNKFADNPVQSQNKG